MNGNLITGVGYFLRGFAMIFNRVCGVS